MTLSMVDATNWPSGISSPETATPGSAGTRPLKSGSMVRSASLNRISAVCSEMVLTVPTPYCGCRTDRPMVSD